MQGLRRQRQVRAGFAYNRQNLKVHVLGTIMGTFLFFSEFR